MEIGVIGAGRISHGTHLPLINGHEESSLSFVADVDGERVRRVAKTFGTDAVHIQDGTEFPECDALILAIPVGTRDEYFQRFSERDVAIFAEKPFATDTGSHKRWAGASEQIACDYTRLEFRTTDQIRTLMESSLLGSLKSVHYRQHLFGPTGISPTSYKMDAELSGGGALIEFGVHLLGEIDFFFEDYRLDLRDVEMESMDGLDIDTSFTLHAESDTGSVPIEIDLSWVEPEANIARYEFDGGTVAYDLAKPSATLVLEDGHRRLPMERDDRYPDDHKEAVWSRLRSFLERVRDGRTFDETRPRVTEIIEEVYQRGREGSS